MFAVTLPLSHVLLPKSSGFAGVLRFEVQTERPAQCADLGVEGGLGGS